ncbi:MAG: amino acid racemase [Litorimonas sp.]
MTSYPITPTIGILGGASNVATGQMYARINELSQARLNKSPAGHHIVQTLISGMDFGVIEHAVRHDNWDALSDYLDIHLDRLTSADIVICGSNTLHQRVASLMETRPQTFLHIADPTIHAMKRAGVSHAALFGTKPVMSAAYMVDYYGAAGIKISVPTETEQTDIDRIIFDELCSFNFRPESRQRYVEIARRLSHEKGIQGVILGCTEIEGLVKPDDLPELPLFDTMDLLCKAAVSNVLD